MLLTGKLLLFLMFKLQYLVERSTVDAPATPELTIAGIPEYGESVIITCTTTDNDVTLTLTRSNGEILAREVGDGDSFVSFFTAQEVLVAEKP